MSNFAKLTADGLERAGLPGDNLNRGGVSELFGLSDFLVRAAQRDPVAMQDWLAAKSYNQRLSPEQVHTDIAELVLQFPLAAAKRADLPAVQQAVRALRYRIQRTVIWRHLSRQADLAETTAALSALADGLLEFALGWSEAVVAQSEGQPQSETADPVRLVIFALGKLGGRELNLSSDIDLICAYSASGTTTGSGKTNQQFFVLVVQLLIRVLGETTGDGFGFRIDLRLRPYGDSGPVVQPFAAMERYFETSGRDWERYALIKARACAGDLAGGEELLERLRPFVYRRYLDFAAIDSMREMRAQIRRDQSVHLGNVKLGAGGIRDVEFLVQMLQLIWGGRIEALRTNSLHDAMAALVAENLLTSTDRETLLSGYRFFRDVEHVLQAFRDEQTHSLPVTAEDQLRLAVALGLGDYAAVEGRLRQLQAQVLACLDRWLDPNDETQSRSSEEVLSAAVHEGLLEAVAGRANQVLHDIRAVAARAPESLVPQRLEQLLPLLLTDLVGELHGQRAVIGAAPASKVAPTVPPIDVVLLRLEPLLVSVLRRSAYLVLLSENASVRQELITLSMQGDYFTSLLARHPALLEELFMRISLAAVPDLLELRAELAVLLADVSGDDLQQQHFDQLAQYKSQHQLRCLLALSRGDLNVMQMADYLTRLAESVIEVVLRWAMESVGFAQPGRFAVIGYGKLGGFEQGAGSDLDLVFLHDHPSADHGTLHLLTRRVLSYLAMQTYFGPLYEVDIRLRPAGRDGTMVSSLAGFANYQQKSAWLWEHQALVRARPVAGSKALAEDFLALRRSILGAPREKTETRREIVAMRERMRANISIDSAASAIKQGPGGIVDIEFMVQYLALGWAAEFPSLLDFTDNARILEQAAEAGLLEQAAASRLIADYAELRRAGQLLIVAPGSAGTDSLREVQDRVASLWQQWMID